MPWYHPGYPSSAGGGSDSNWVSAEFDSDGNIAKLSDCAGDGVPTSGTRFVKNIDSAHNCWLIHGLSISMYTMNDSTWEEKDCIIVQSDANNNRTFDFDDNVGNGLRFGVADLTDVNKPIIYGDCYYCYDGLYQDGSYTNHRLFRNYSSNFESGRIQLYGGIFETWGCMDNDGVIMYFTSGNSSNATHVIGTHFLRFAGLYTGDSYGRFQEVLFSCSTRTGIAFATSNDTIGYTDLINENIRQALAFGLSGGSAPFIRQLQLRQAVSSYGIFYYYGETTPQAGYIINSDEILNLDPASIIDGYSQTGQSLNIWFEERSTYMLKVVNASSSNLQDVSVILRSTARIVGRTSNIEDYNRILFSGNTDTNGEITQQEIVKKHYYPGATPNKVEYLDYSIQLSKYGYKIYYSLRDIGYSINSGINEIVVLEEDTFINENYTTVNSYTGLSINFDTKKIVLSEEHTIQELYDWISLQVCKNQNAYYTIDLPLITNDGATFTLNTNWKIYNSEFLSIGTQIIEFHDGSKYVPILLSGIIEGSRYYINSGATVYYYGEIGISGNVSKTWKWYIDKTVSIVIRLKGYLPINISATINNNGLNLPITQVIDSNYNP